ncbi:ABC transporter substrate-binding protein [Hydrogenophaga sp.]|uniref:ABC transporter substrate-binding protein n=1 Tax=Hydrogenophaga sp. TaxID=1904254 RepID=UPI002730551F|nr:ABC transporter substrate-binding protein [Hydrogenophaga sp.]MDP2016372.1 ABC transporter substrate-binding protein [Hydrogenophaga sp.]MDP3166129.1 ABC transporter substrate-binding protein [Hydrogenophaga sp.]MDP3812372.1 ABC transporter substrate-binding protein [Hydrogenophaga sp.]
MKTPLSTTLPATSSRRTVLQLGVASAAIGVLGAPSIVRAQAATKVRLGYWPIAAGLPFYAAIELGYFKEAGLDVEPLKFAGAQQVMEAVLSGRSDGTANGTGSANVAIGELAQPGTFKIFCANPSNVKNVLDEVIVPVASTAKVMADLKGKRVASGPGIQNVTLAKTVLERGGATGATVVELPIGQHVAALAAGQIDGAYTLEPTGTIGRLNGTSRVLEAGVISRYVLGDNMAPWFGGSASLSSEFIKKNPEVAKKFIAAYAKGVAYVRSKPVEARKYLTGYTPIEGALAGEVPLAAYTMYNEFSPADVAHFQKFFDLFSEKGIFSSRLMVDTMIYKG